MLIIELVYGATILLLGIYQKELKQHVHHTCKLMFISELSIIVNKEETLL